MANVYRFELTSVDTTSGKEGLTHVHYQTSLAVGDSETSAADLLDEILQHYSSSGHNMSVWQGVMRNSTKLTKARLVEEVAPGSGDLADVAEESLNVVGTRGTISGDHLPAEMCLWFGFKSDVASRSARGGTHLPSIIDASELNSTGLWDTGYVNAAAVIALADAIKDDINDVFGTTGTSDINPVIYSRTRRSRGQSPYTFDLKSVIRSDKPRWLRRRAT
jgi:hypothetical protein